MVDVPVMMRKYVEADGHQQLVTAHHHHVQEMQRREELQKAQEKMAKPMPYGFSVPSCLNNTLDKTLQQRVE